MFRPILISSFLVCASCSLVTDEQPNEQPSDQTVNQAPTASPFQSGDIILSQASDSDSSTLTYNWSLSSNNVFLSADKDLNISTLKSSYDGIQSVKLTVSDGESTKEFLVSVDFGSTVIDNPPSALFTSSAPSATIFNNQPVSVSFDAQNSTDDNSIVSYNWTVGNQNYQDMSIVHNFTQAGTFLVSLTVTDNAGQTDQTSINYVVSETIEQPQDIAVAMVDQLIGTTQDTFTFNSDNSTLYGTNHSYTWQINNQTFTNASTQYNFPSPGTYLATLEIKNAQNAIASDSIEVKVSAPLDATISASDDTVEVDQSITFNASGADSSIVQFQWRIDNQTFTTQSVDYSFDTLGEHTVELLITNNIGLTESETRTISVIASIPESKISVVSTNMLTVNLDVEPDSSPIAYQWNVNGQLYASKTLTHTFISDGTYPITLSADYGNGWVLLDSTTVSINLDNTQIQACNLTSTGDPYCGAHFSVDTDNDGWGMENNTSCVYINGPADPAPGSCFDDNPGDDYMGKGAGLSSLVTFPVGLAIPDGTGTSGVSILNNGTRQNIVKDDFSQITVENKMKMSYVENSFVEADAIVDWAEQNNIGVHGHALVWHHESQLPTWAVNPTANFKNDFVDSITRTASHFAGKVYSWDVVNEALYDEYDGTGHTDNNGLRNSVYFNQYNGSEYIHEAFRAARAADPDAILYYNDFSTENNQAKTTALVNLIQELLDNDVPIDGVGFQMHVVNSWPSVSDIRASIKKIVDLDPNLIIKITELDVRINNVYDGNDSNDFTGRNDCLGANSCAGLEAQKARYKEIIQAYFDVVPEHRRGGISIWGVADLDSWLYENNGPNNTPDWPLLFDDNFDKKPAFYGVEEVFKGLNPDEEEPAVITGQGLSSLAPFPIGLAIPDGTGRSGVSIQNDPIRQNILKADFSQITVENKMKMSYLENSFTDADAIVDWARANDLGVNGHALVWHHTSQLPTWAVNPQSDFKEQFIAQITRTATHFADRVYSWDVVNEALYDKYDGAGHTDNNGLRNSVYFNQYNGSEYIHEAFRTARAADPDAILYYNDFSTEVNDYKTTALVNLIQELLDNNVPIDGVGFQMHVVNSYPSIANIKAAMKQIVDLDPNLLIKITELDVRINNVYDGDESNDYVNRSDCNVSCDGLEVQKQKYKDIINAYLEVVPAHRRGGITMWGVADLDSWLYEDNGERNLPDWPLLFNDNFEKKPAFYGVEEALQTLNF